MLGSRQLSFRWNEKHELGYRWMMVMHKRNMSFMRVSGGTCHQQDVQGHSIAKERYE